MYECTCATMYVCNIRFRASTATGDWIPFSLPLYSTLYYDRHDMPRPNMTWVMTSAKTMPRRNPVLMMLIFSWTYPRSDSRKIPFTETRGASCCNQIFVNTRSNPVPHFRPLDLGSLSQMESVCIDCRQLMPMVKLVLLCRCETRPPALYRRRVAVATSCT